MSTPAPEMMIREREKLYLTDAELIRRIGLPDKTARHIIGEAERKFGFPKKSTLMGGRRYWPAVKAWLDRFNGLDQVDKQAPNRDIRRRQT